MPRVVYSCGSAYVLKMSSCKEKCNLSFIFYLKVESVFHKGLYPTYWRLLWIYQAKQHSVRSNLPVSSVSMNFIRVSHLRSQQKLSACPAQGCPTEMVHGCQVKAMIYYFAGDGAGCLCQRLLLWDVTHRGAFLDHYKIYWFLPFALANWSGLRKGVSQTIQTDSISYNASLTAIVARVFISAIEPFSGSSHEQIIRQEFTPWNVKLWHWG